MRIMRLFKLVTVQLPAARIVFADTDSSASSAEWWGSGAPPPPLTGTAAADPADSFRGRGAARRLGDGCGAAPLPARRLLARGGLHPAESALRLCGTAHTLLDDASYSSRWWPALSACAGGPFRVGPVPRGPKFEFGWWLVTTPGPARPIVAPGTPAAICFGPTSGTSRYQPWVRVPQESWGLRTGYFRPRRRSNLRRQADFRKRILDKIS